MKAALIAFAFLPVLACAARAQEPSRRGWPPAKEVVRQFLAGETNVPVATAVGACPDQNPYGDTVWTALLRAPQTQELTARLAPAWTIPLVKCGDERIVDWYRTQLLAADGVLTAQLFLYPLRGHGTPETLSFLNELAFDPSRSVPLRNEILSALAYGATAEERKNLYLEGLDRQEGLPSPYAGREAWFLVNSPVAEGFVTGVVDLIVQRRGGPSTADLLTNLAIYEPVRASARLRAHVFRAVDAILTSPGARPDLVDAAEYVRDVQRTCSESR